MKEKCKRKKEEKQTNPEMSNRNRNYSEMVRAK